MPRCDVVDSFKDIKASWSLGEKVRTVFRNSVVNALSFGRSIAASSNWIRFPYYHHVFDDERRGFERHLTYLKNYGDFLALDTVVEMLESNMSINGRFFCVTFDDGLKSCFDNALPVLAEMNIPATFFLVTELIADTSLGETRVCRPLHTALTYCYEYLIWSECAQMLRAGMTIGSHTLSHARLYALDESQTRHQLVLSKNIIERKLGIECKHFACPWGQVGKHFDIRDAKIAREAGYRSFLTTHRGRNQWGTSPFALSRDHLYANWSVYQLRYFFSLRETQDIEI